MHRLNVLWAALIFLFLNVGLIHWYRYVLAASFLLGAGYLL